MKELIFYLKMYLRNLALRLELFANNIEMIKQSDTMSQNFQSRSGGVNDFCELSGKLSLLISLESLCISKEFRIIL